MMSSCETTCSKKDVFCLQSDLIHQSVYELIHTEDRAEFQKQLHWALNPSCTLDTGQLVQGRK